MGGTRADIPPSGQGLIGPFPSGDGSNWSIPPPRNDAIGRSCVGGRASDWLSTASGEPIDWSLCGMTRALVAREWTALPLTASPLPARLPISCRGGWNGERLVAVLAAARGRGGCQERRLSAGSFCFPAARAAAVTHTPHPLCFSLSLTLTANIDSSKCAIIFLSIKRSG